MPNFDLSTTASGAIGTVSYVWTISQTAGTTISGVSIAGTTATATVTYPSGLTFLGSSASSGTYTFTAQVVASDSGVSSCTATRTKALYFDDTPPGCTLALSPITIVEAP